MLEELQDLFQGVPDFVIHLLGGKGDELRGEIGQELFRTPGAFRMQPVQPNVLDSFCSLKASLIEKVLSTDFLRVDLIIRPQNP